MCKALLIDIGSTNIKWAKSQVKGNIYDVKSFPFPKKLDYPEPYYEVDINRIMDIVKNIIDDNIDCEELFISTQMHGYVLTDQQFIPVLNYISWRDLRAKKINKNFHIPHSSGTASKENLPKISLAAIKKYQKDIYDLAKHFFTLGSYVTHYITGLNETHISDACPSGFYSVLTGKHEKYDINLPLAHKVVTPVGLYNGMIVNTAVGDQQASVYGINNPEKKYILNIGSACQICCIEPTYTEGCFESRPYFNGQTLCTITNLLGGIYIENNLNEFLEDELYNNYSTAIKQLPKKDSIVVVGGTLTYHLELIEAVLKRMNISYTIDLESNALIGLSKLIKE